MFDPGEFDPTLYWVHVVLGSGSAVFALGALFARKGGLVHKWSGRFFAVSMGVAAITALYFFGAGPPAPPILISATAALYAIGMAILSLRPREGLWRFVQWALIPIPVLIALLYFAFIGFAVLNPDIPLYLGILGPMAAVLFGVIAWSDIRFMRTREPSKHQRARRHGFRMAVVSAEVVRAPLVSLGPPFLGERTFDFYSFGPFLLIPLIYFLARPEWLKGQQRLPDTR
ncbi:MAG: bL34 family ribosomal protein [Pseudomonadota bacterium]